MCPLLDTCHHLNEFSTLNALDLSLTHLLMGILVMHDFVCLIVIWKFDEAYIIWKFEITCMSFYSASIHVFIAMHLAFYIAHATWPHGFSNTPNSFIRLPIEGWRKNLSFMRRNGNGMSFLFFIPLHPQFKAVFCSSPHLSGWR